MGTWAVEATGWGMRPGQTPPTMLGGLILARCRAWLAAVLQCGWEWPSGGRGHAWRHCSRADDLITGGLCPWVRLRARIPASPAMAGSPHPHPAPSNRQPSVGECKEGWGLHHGPGNSAGVAVGRGRAHHPRLDLGDACPAGPCQPPRRASWEWLPAGILAEEAPGQGPGALYAVGPSLFLGPHPAILSEP